MSADLLSLVRRMLAGGRAFEAQPGAPDPSAAVSQAAMDDSSGLGDSGAALWGEILRALPWLDWLEVPDRERLHVLSTRFLERKAITGAAGFIVDDRVRLAIAAQACLPVLRLGLEAYDDFVEIIVYPDRFIVERDVIDEVGVVHRAVQELAGEAMEKGPVVLSWADAQPGRGEPWNVVIHEFAHKIDLCDGVADGIPPMNARDRTQWGAEIEACWQGFCEQLDRIEALIPRHVDPESPEGEAWYARLPLDPYAATDRSEFFAVAVETFFVDPEPLAATFPELYRLFSTYFRLDPLKKSDVQVANRVHDQAARS